MEQSHTYETTVNGEEIIFEDKSHAGISRQFWAHFMNLDLDKTIKTIELMGIRTSDSAYFISKNGSKKKNIFVKDNYYVYTHLTPDAMKKAYEKFVKGWEQNDETTQVETLSQKQEAAPVKPETKEKPNLKNIYKKSLAIELIKKGHDLHHTMRNRNNPKYQVFTFVETPGLIEDLVKLSQNNDDHR
ncbi:hypothetical protein J2S09_000144 [Bacillus fengqiuensis]|nr:hypothetical protein [Bacillus fengqiuensis]